MKIYLAQINTTVGDLEGNVDKVLEQFKKAEEQNCDLIIFPEMTITGYPAQDLWRKKSFLQKTNEKIAQIMLATKQSQCAVLIGAPHVFFDRGKKEIIYNSAFLIEKGEVKNVIHKKSLPNYGVFDENRYFKAATALSYVEFRGQTLAILICEDLWNLQNLYLMQEQILDAVIVMNASPYSSNKALQREELVGKYVQNLKKPLIYLNLVGGQDELVFDGSSFVFDENGNKILQMKEFAQDEGALLLNKGSATVLYQTKNQISNQLQRDYSACVLGLRDYVRKSGFSKVMLGMSGGIDSALVAVMAVDALGSENVALYALPTRFNSQTSMDDALECANKISCNLQVISIEKVFQEMLLSCGGALRQAQRDNKVAQHDNKAVDLAKENMQSRIRGNILMAISNAAGALLLSTGNKSELAVGYATIYGDMCGAFNPLKDLYKTQVYKLAKWRNENIPEIAAFKKISLISQSILLKEPTAELRENQKDSDSLPPYDVLDKILFALIDEEKSVDETVAQGLEKILVKKVAKLILVSEYKRRQAVIGVKISEMSFDKDRRYPLVNKF